MMSELLQARVDIIKKLNLMVRKIEGVTVFLLVGSKRCPSSEIRTVIASADRITNNNIYSDINFLISEFLSPVDSSYLERNGRIIKKYSFQSGMSAEITVCSENNLPHADWWVSYIDKNSAALNFYSANSKYPSDPVQYDGFDDFEDDFDDDGFDEDIENSPDEENFDEDISESVDEPPKMEMPEPIYLQDCETAAQPVEESAEAPIEENSDDLTVDENLSQSDESEQSEEPPADDESEDLNNSEELSEYVYDRVAVAKRAISGGSVIHAGEVINELRTLLIKLICEKSGIKDNYVYSIDLLSNDYQKELLKTYPTSMDSGAMVSAIAAELSLFEKLL